MWVYVRTGGAWREQLADVGLYAALRARTLGFVDLIDAGPGFLHGVWRWTGTRYALACVAGRGPRTGQPRCPVSLSTVPAADSLPPFVPGRAVAAPTPCGAAGRFEPRGTAAVGGIFTAALRAAQAAEGAPPAAPLPVKTLPAAKRTRLARGCMTAARRSRGQKRRPTPALT